MSSIMQIQLSMNNPVLVHVVFIRCKSCQYMANGDYSVGTPLPVFTATIFNDITYIIQAGSLVY